MDAMNAIRNGWKDKKGVINKPSPDAEKFYWQIVSNACIYKCKWAELVVYMPYKSQLASLKLLADGNPDYYRIWSSQDEELPFLPDDGFYNSVNIIRFRVPDADKLRLEQFVIDGGKMLENFNQQ
jgi:hypothetical protein